MNDCSLSLDCCCCSELVFVHMDVQNAFFHGTLHEVVYMLPPLATSSSDSHMPFKKLVFDNHVLITRCLLRFVKILLLGFTLR